MVKTFNGFVPIHTIFYSVFHPTEGTKVCYEFPPGNLAKHNINFDTVKNYVIPKPQLCHKLLTLKYNDYRIVGYPVTINSQSYARNNFSFNFVFVFPYDCETSPYEPVVVRLGKMFRLMEEQSQLLSKAEKDMSYFHFNSTVEQDSDVLSGSNMNETIDTRGNTKPFAKTAADRLDTSAQHKPQISLQDILMRIYQDLNSYSECLIPIDSGNSIDVKLFQIPTPPNSSISIEDVPIPTVNLNKIIDVNWDPTMLKIVPYVDGLNSIAKIAKLSDSDPILVIECVNHFIYYGCVMFSDIFQYSNIYAPTSSIRNFLLEPKMASECQLYVTSNDSSMLSKLPFTKSDQSRSSPDRHISKRDARASVHSSSNSQHSESDSVFYKENSTDQIKNIYSIKRRSESSISSANTNDNKKKFKYLPTKSTLFDLYRSLKQGVPLKEWYKENFATIRRNNIDVRRFIIFGLINGIIYRSYSFPILKNYDTSARLKQLQNLRIEQQSKNKRNQENKIIFSTSDITFGDEEIPHKRNLYQSLDNDVAEKLLKDVFEKLYLIKNDGSNVEKPNRNVLEYDLPKKFASEVPYLPVDSNKNSSTVSKVSFDQKLGRGSSHFSSDSSDNEEQKQLLMKRARQELLVLEALENADNLDKICVTLEAPRQTVEDILKGVVDYSIINS